MYGNESIRKNNLEQISLSEKEIRALAQTLCNNENIYISGFKQNPEEIQSTIENIRQKINNINGDEEEKREEAPSTTIPTDQVNVNNPYRDLPGRDYYEKG